ncbi:MAG: hypothetical protein FWH22_10005 [Fibromonadales bacterium]|nr:hypothetical protein [Fibromonadales bacterium]
MRRIIFLLLATLQITFASVVAVLEIVPNNENINLSISEFRHLTDELRKQARETLPRNAYSILTRDNIIQLMPPDADQAECLAESCAIEIGRAIGAEYVTQGFVGDFDGMLTLTVELYESMSGNLLGSFVTESESVRGLLGTIRKQAAPLFANINKGRKPASRPAPVAAPAPVQRNNPAPSHLQFDETSSSRLVKSNTNFQPNNTNYYEEDFGTGERLVAAALNIIPGLGSYFIMDDFAGVVIPWTLMVIGFYVAAEEAGGEDIGIVLFTSGYLFGFVRPFLYNKSKSEVRVISSKEKSGFNMAVLTNKQGTPKAYLLYNRNF